MKLHTEIIIEATSKKVWEVLMDFDSYGLWNPFIIEIKGEAEEGKTIEVNFPGMKFTPTVLTREENREFKWLGKLLFKGLFDGEHRFELEEMEEGRTRLIHSEKFSGLLVPMFRKKLLGETKEGFEQMNLKLKERVEGKA